MSTPQFDKIKQKIEKLLRLADPSRGGSDAERLLAMNKAQELMVEHQLSEADLDLANEHKRQWDVVEEVFKMGRKEQPWDKFIYWALRECTDCTIIWDHYFENTEKAFMVKRLSLILVGTPDDIAFAKLLIPLLDHALNRGCSAYLRAKGLKWTAWLAKGYYHGLVQGFITASTDGRAAVWRKQTKEKADRYAIVVADKKEAIAKFVEENHDNLRQRRGKSSYNYSTDAAAAGHTDGSRLNVHSTVGAGNVGALL